MKRITTILLLTLVLALPQVYGQEQGQRNHGWFERMRSEKIAFLTAEMGLTPEEAQAFWPLYNQVEREHQDAVESVGKTYYELELAINTKASDTEIESKLRAYAKAIETCNALEGVQLTRYSKVLSKAKIGKLYVAEEKFRRQQIYRLHKPQAQR